MARLYEYEVDCDSCGQTFTLVLSMPAEHIDQASLARLVDATHAPTCPAMIVPAAPPMYPCRWCGSANPSHHVRGERKCCPDCDHRIPEQETPRV